MRTAAQYVRYEAAEPDRHGRHPGVFALANGLGRGGHLSPADHPWWRRTNDWCNAAYPDPTSVEPTCYDPQLNPCARAWFRAEAEHLLDVTRQYLDLLDRYGVPWRELSSDDLGRIVYADDVQVVAVPVTVPG